MSNDPRPGEDDIDKDDATALSRATGGVPAGHPDEISTTGTGETEGFVGRIAGDDVGSAEEQGGERRARWEAEHGPA